MVENKVYGSYTEFYEEISFSMRDTLIHFDEIRDLFFSFVEKRRLNYEQVIEYFNVETDTFAHFLEVMDETYSWFDYRMVPNIIEFLTVLIADEFDDDYLDDEDDDYIEWYNELETELKNKHKIELTELLQHVKYRLNVEHFYEKDKTPQQSVEMITYYYITEIEKIQKGYI